MIENNGKKRVIIERVMPEVDNGRFPIKRVPGEAVDVEAHAYPDGHDAITVMLNYKHEADKNWSETRLQLRWNDEWYGSFKVEKEGTYLYTVSAYVDHFRTWKRGLIKKAEAKQELSVEFKIGAKLLSDAADRAGAKDKKALESAAELLNQGGEKALAAAASDELEEAMIKYPDPAAVSLYRNELKVSVERARAGFSAWYEIFPRSCSGDVHTHGTFADVEKKLPEIAAMGFDVLYFPPIHPIGFHGRKGKNNSLQAAAKDPGSPWAVQDHMKIHPQLGTMEDFKQLIKAAAKNGMEIALDIAFQCAPDHPYIKKHPEWFTHRPDGTIQHAENPPKKYEDIVPFNFENDDWQGLWEELTNVFMHWAEAGVRIFRVDNPHTKPFAFWEYSLAKVKAKHPGTIFLAEAFTRPKVMHLLAKLGFTQSYTYFTWRNTKRELEEYVTELTKTESKEFFYPNFWPNTPDILHEYLVKGGRPAHLIRLALAATLSGNYGMYGGTYITCENEPFPGKEENNHNEKYEIKDWDLDREGSIKKETARVNKIRKENRALQATCNTRLCGAENDNILFYIKSDPEKENIIMTVVNLDYTYPQNSYVDVPAHEYGLPERFKVEDLMWGGVYEWQAGRNYVELNPAEKPFHIFRVKKA